MGPLIHPPCAGCGHPFDWHEPDEDDPLCGTRECSPPDGNYCPCLDYVPPNPPLSKIDENAAYLCDHGKRRSECDWCDDP